MNDKERELDIIGKTKKCRHYSVDGMKKRCALDIDIRALVGGDDVGWATRLPCSIFTEAKNGQRSTCESRSQYTREEAEAMVDKEDKFYTQALVAIEAAHEDALAKGFGMPTKKNPHLKGGQSELNCPICKEGKIRYTVAVYNGHMHACCTTPNCVRWME
jgi:ssDNA-binding Zn-finger/Zn-ribbon topoisomerase 1